MTYSALHLFGIIFGCFVVLARGDDCSTDELGDEYCTTSVTTSISTLVIFSQTSTVTSISTAPLTTVSISGSVLIIPTILTSSLGGNPALQTPTANAANSGSRPHSLASGAKAGIGIGVVAAVCLIGAIAWLAWRRVTLLKYPTESHRTEVTEKNSPFYGTVPRPELDGTDATCHTSDTTSNHKGPSYLSYRSSTLQGDNPGTRRGSVSRPADELFIPTLEQAPAYRPEVYATNADSQVKAEQARSGQERPKVLSIGRGSVETSIQPSARSSQDEQRTSVPHPQTQQTGTMPGLIEEEKRLDEHIGETIRLEEFYEQKRDYGRSPEKECSWSELKKGVE